MKVATLDMISIEFPSPTFSVARRLQYSLATLLLLGSFTSALFLGWGWGDLLELFSHPARAALLVALMIQLAFAVAQARPLARSTTRATGHPSEILSWLMVAAGLLVVASSAFWDRRILFVLPGEDLTRYAGLGLFLLGLAINTWSQNLIGRRRDAGSPAGSRRLGKGLRLVDCGPVHPGLMIAVIGLPMVFLSQVGLVGTACLVAAMAVRLIWRAGATGHRGRALDRRLQAA